MRLLLLLSVVILVGCNSKVEIPPPTTLPALAPGVHQETVTLPNGTPLRYTISVPRGYNPAKPAPLIVGLHYGGDVTPFYGAGMIDTLMEPAFHSLGPVMIAPDALGGGDWTTAANEQAVVWLTRSVMQSYAIDKNKVLLTGFSMGGQGAWHIGGRHQDLYPAVLPVAGPPAGGEVEWTVPVYVIHSDQDKVIPLATVKGHIDRLRAAGAKVQLNRPSNLSHYQTKAYAEYMAHAVPWLHDIWR